MVPVLSWLLHRRKRQLMIKQLCLGWGKKVRTGLGHKGTPLSKCRPAKFLSHRATSWVIHKGYLTTAFLSVQHPDFYWVNLLGYSWKRVVPAVILSLLVLSSAAYNNNVLNKKEVYFSLMKRSLDIGSPGLLWHIHGHQGSRLYLARPPS